MKKYKNVLILTTLVTLLPIPVQLLLGREWSISLTLPLMLLAVQWFCIFWTFKDPRQKNQGHKPTLMVLWIVPILSNLLSAMDYCLMKGMDFSISAVCCLTIGLIFLVIGNYMPKVRQNATLGVKVYWTYTSEENWNATHRYAGRLWVIGGAVMLLGVFLPETWAIWLMAADILVLCVLPIVYAYRYYRMQKQRGDVLTPIPRFSGKFAWISLAVLVLVLVLVGALMVTGDIAYQFRDTYLLIEADYYDDLMIHYDAIDTVEFREETVDGIRAWGFGSARLLMGTFQNQEFGNYTRYTYTGAQSAVVLTTQERTVVLSGENPEETRQIYDALCQHTGK